MLAEDVINKALLAHGEWKRRLAQAIQDGKELTPELAAADDQCELGKWLCLDTAVQCQPVCERVKKLHSDFHREASRILALAQAGRRNEAMNAVALDSEFTRLSGALAFALDRWRFKAHRATLDGQPISPR